MGIWTYIPVGVRLYGTVAPERDPAAARRLDTAVLRLRKALGDSKIVATVVKRGYRLAVDENFDAALI